MPPKRGDYETWNEWRDAIQQARIDILLRFFHLKSRRNESCEISAEDQKHFLKYLSGLHREITRLQELEDCLKDYLNSDSVNERHAMISDLAEKVNRKSR